MTDYNEMYQKFNVDQQSKEQFEVMKNAEYSKKLRAGMQSTETSIDNDHRRKSSNKEKHVELV